MISFSVGILCSLLEYSLICQQCIHVYTGSVEGHNTWSVFVSVCLSVLMLNLTVSLIVKYILSIFH